MNEGHKTLLRVNRVMLVNDLIMNEDFFSNINHHRVVISEDMRDSITSLKYPTRKSQNGAFLDTLNRRGPLAFEEFIRSLVFSYQSDLAFALDTNLASVYTDKYEEQTMKQRSHAAPKVEPSPAKAAKLLPQQPPKAFVPPQINPAVISSATGDMTAVPKEMVDSPIMRVEMQNIDANDPNVQLEQLNEEISYKMSRVKRGRALIINNEYFLDTKLPLREGSQFDVMNICELFKNLHFDTTLKDNVTAQGMRKLLEEERHLQFNSEAFILFIMSHGTHGCVFGTDGKSLNIESEIAAMFDGKNCPDLLNKPKMFFIQACQGEMKSAGLSGDRTDAAKEDMDVPTTLSTDEDVANAMKQLSIMDNEDSTPTFDRTTHEKADMLLAYSTLPGYLAWRNSDFGSWFVRSIVYVFSKYSHQCHLMDLLLYVRQLMNNMRTTDLENRFMQITTTSDRLLKKVYFCPGHTVTSM